MSDRSKASDLAHMVLEHEELFPSVAPGTGSRLKNLAKAVLELDREVGDLRDALTRLRAELRWMGAPPLDKPTKNDD